MSNPKQCMIHVFEKLKFEDKKYKYMIDNPIGFRIRSSINECGDSCSIEGLSEYSYIGTIKFLNICNSEFYYLDINHRQSLLNTYIPNKVMIPFKKWYNSTVNIFEKIDNVKFYCSIIECINSLESDNPLLLLD